MFAQALDELSNKIWLKIKDNPKFEDGLYYALEEWCNKLNLPQNISFYIKNQLQNSDASYPRIRC